MTMSYPASRWDTLGRVCAALSGVIEIARGAAVFDRESIAIGALLLAFAAITFTRRAGVGWIGVGALFVNQGFWMLTAIVDLTHAAPSVIGAAAPALLSVAAVVGLAAVVLRTRPARASAAVPLALSGVVVAALLVVAVPMLGRDAQRVHPGDLRISAHNVEFSTNRLTAHPGDIGVVFRNKDLFWHTFTIRKLHVNLRVATSGRGRVVIKDVPAGTYRFICAIPGHEAAGMKGELVVT
ncbi:MAG TPA: cupredoxin domain-containing protein [Acidimicrobiales bacterium]|nr:cupredoxin domain-containing protein [Acidimicrobiales bacterium]